ncbi:MAG: hypothetical protein FWD46_09015 [Cystobacterineae bacterium]|nr:hypothetical protein [Cystobacterineae bacterium]
MKILSYMAAVLYPALVFCGLFVWGIPLRVFCLALAAFGLLLLLGAAHKKKIPLPPLPLPRASAASPSSNPSSCWP